MNNTDIDDEILEVWVGQKNGMLEKTKSRKFNWCAFLFGGYYYLYRKMYLIGILNIVLSIFLSLFISILVGIIEATLYGSVTHSIAFSVLTVPIINGFIFYPFYKIHIKNVLRRRENQKFNSIQIAQLKGGVSPWAVAIGIVIMFSILVFIILTLIILLVMFFGYMDYSNNYQSRSYDYYDDYYYDDYNDDYWDDNEFLDDNEYYFNI